ncbi:DUF3298 and DUF4163 domain-containing protein [Pedobacter sp. BS3]|uniref:DUF3298 and DUF4163 domain-containing protein n=1 Tax=Pedobacter sp. BS3 TaxID=2567937 RepID=UPI0011EDD52F|nr:DUF3298 and DUF4163 domain-containing protein [Pedobacter sp. BS3]TZF84464.1 DUF3298 and DUF4163 domain-containing protein [Pedobacter sp. BS3]
MKNICKTILILSFFAACTSPQKEQKSADSTTTQQPDSSRATTDTITYTYTHYRKESKNVVKANNVTDTSYVQVSYPKFASAELNAFVKSLVINEDEPDAKYITVEDMAADFIKNFDNFFNQEKRYRTSWYRETAVKVATQQPGIIGFETYSSEYTGGAHPNYNYSYENYDLSRHKNMLLDDLFTPENKLKLDSIAEAIFRKQEKLSPDASLKDDYFFENGKFALNQNFLITDKGLLFLYNPYEIKAYVYGVTKLLIPYNQIEDLLKPNTAIAAYIKHDQRI